MKHILITFVAILLSSFLFSCNGNKKEMDSLVCEDFFEVIVLSPNDDVKKAIGDSMLSFILNHSDYYGDTLIIKIECNARWETSRNDDPFLIRINEIDTSWFYLTINEGESTETSMNWKKEKDRPILKTIKAILDTGSFSLYCFNYDDVSPQSILSRYYDSIAKTEISFTMRLTNGKDWEMRDESEKPNVNLPSNQH